MLHFLLPLSPDYPDIERWYHNKVIPGLRAGTRVVLPIERQGQLVGVGIAKKELGERKICTVRIAPSHVGRGMGMRIFERLMHWLDDDHPHLTVGAQKLPAFERIFDYYGFALSSAHPGLYVPGAVELAFNEGRTPLDSR